MKKYELVVIINPNLSKEDQNQIISSIESMFPNGYEQKDEMGVLKTYNFEPAGKNHLALYVSYLLELNGDNILDIKKKLSFVKGVWRYVFFAMTNKVSFVKHSEINAKFAEAIKVFSVKKSTKNQKEEKKVIIDEANNTEISEENQEEVKDNLDVIPDYQEPKKRPSKKKED